jgi:hypothetical protein
MCRYMSLQDEMTVLRTVCDAFSGPAAVKGQFIWQVGVVHSIIDLAHELGQFGNPYPGEKFVEPTVQDLPFIPVFAVFKDLLSAPSGEAFSTHLFVKGDKVFKCAWRFYRPHGSLLDRQTGGNDDGPNDLVCLFLAYPLFQP